MKPLISWLSRRFRRGPLTKKQAEVLATVKFP